jgi:hypothetical protein
MATRPAARDIVSPLSRRVTAEPCRRASTAPITHAHPHTPHAAYITACATSRMINASGRRRRAPTARSRRRPPARQKTSDLPSHDGVDIRGYVANLPEHLAACDAAIVQGGLTTTMELVATGTPFLYFPLGHHFEQQRHVRHRLDRHRAGRCLDYAQTDPDDIAAALVEQLNAPRDYLPVPSDGAARAAALVADLL